MHPIECVKLSLCACDKDSQAHVNGERKSEKREREREREREGDLHFVTRYPLTTLLLLLLFGHFSGEIAKSLLRSREDEFFAVQKCTEFLPS